MNPFTDAQRQELGLRPEDVLEEAETVEAPTASTGQGLAGPQPEAVMPLPRLIEQVLPRAAPSFPRARSSLLERVADLVVSFWPAVPGVAFVYAEGAELWASTAAHWFGPRELAVDARSGPALVRVKKGDADLLLRFTRDQVEVRPIRSEVPAFARLTHWREPAEELVKAPDPIAWIAGWPVEPWLLEESVLAASAPASVARLCAAGLIGRLWTAGKAGSTPDVRERVLRGDATPADRAAQWVASLDGALLAQVARATVHEVVALDDEMETLTAVIAEGHPWAHTLARSWLRRRDDLECCAWALAGLEGEALLRLELQTVDRSASAHHSMWAALPAIRDDLRLRAVSWIEPEAWWGGLSVD